MNINLQNRYILFSKDHLSEINRLCPKKSD
ncbi:hypothetical protein [Levilactobacillus brevis]